MAKQTAVKKRALTPVINLGYALVLSIVAVVLSSQYLVKDPDVVVELAVGLALGAVVGAVLGWILKKSLLVTLLTTTGILLLAGLMLMMQIDYSGF